MIGFGTPTPPRRVTIGLDLGHANDHSALAILEQEQRHRVLRQIARFPLRTPFGEIVKRLDRIARTPDLAGRTTIVADATGLGAPVLEMIRTAKIPAAIVPVVITGGVHANQSNGTWHVPKTDLVTALYLMFEQGGIRIPKGLPGYRALEEELLHFGTARSGIHDDLVMALALAAWHTRPRVKVGARDDGPLL